jgi:hypothetical protein
MTRAGNDGGGEEGRGLMGKEARGRMGERGTGRGREVVMQHNEVGPENSGTGSVRQCCSPTPSHPPLHACCPFTPSLGGAGGGRTGYPSCICHTGDYSYARSSTHPSAGIKSPHVFPFVSQFCPLAPLSSPHTPSLTDTLTMHVSQFAPPPCAPLDPSPSKLAPLQQHTLTN